MVVHTPPDLSVACTRLVERLKARGVVKTDADTSAMRANPSAAAITLSLADGTRNIIVSVLDPALPATAASSTTSVEQQFCISICDAAAGGQPGLSACVGYSSEGGWKQPELDAALDRLGGGGGQGGAAAAPAASSSSSVATPMTDWGSLRPPPPAGSVRQVVPPHPYADYGRSDLVPAGIMGYYPGGGMYMGPGRFHPGRGGGFGPAGGPLPPPGSFGVPQPRHLPRFPGDVPGVAPWGAVPPPAYYPAPDPDHFVPPGGLPTRPGPSTATSGPSSSSPSGFNYGF